VAEKHDHYDRKFVGTSDHDIVSAINAAIAVLKAPPGAAAPTPFSIVDKKKALFLIAHFVGDLHQPLHVGAIYLTASGSKIDPDSLGADSKNTNTHGGNSLSDGGTDLHTEWDALPTNLGKTPSDTIITKARHLHATAGSIDDFAAAWAADTVVMSHKAFEGIKFVGSGPHHWAANFADRTGYLKNKRQLQTQQLTKGGAHLVELLNTVWP
jgi:S1/P1 Nuclease